MDPKFRDASETVPVKQTNKYMMSKMMSKLYIYYATANATLLKALE